MAVHCYDSIGVFADHDAIGIHTECTDLILKLRGTVYDLALIEVIGKVTEDWRRQFYPHPQIHSVRTGGDIHFLAHLLHPLAAASSNGHDAAVCLIRTVRCFHLVPALGQVTQMFHRCIEKEGHLLLQFLVQIPKHHVVDVRAQVSDRSIQ